MQCTEKPAFCTLVVDGSTAPEPALNLHVLGLQALKCPDCFFLRKFARTSRGALYNAELSHGTRLMATLGKKIDFRPGPNKISGQKFALVLQGSRTQVLSTF